MARLEGTATEIECLMHVDICKDWTVFILNGQKHTHIYMHIHTASDANACMRSYLNPVFLCVEPCGD